MTPPAAAHALPAARPGRSSRSPARPASGRPLTVTPGPRRVSGPSRARPRTEPARRAPRARPEAPGLVAGLLRLAPLRLLDLHTVDRLVRGRFAIALVAFALIGIVTMQLGLLKLNSGIGRALVRESVLQRENALLGIENSELAAGSRIQARAGALGMEVVPTEDLRFLSVDPRRDPARALAALKSPAREPAAAERAADAASAASASGAESASSPAAGTGESSASTAPATSTAATGTPVTATGAAPVSGGEASATAGATAAGAGSEATATSAGASSAGASAGEAAAGGPGGGTQAAPAG